MSRRYKVFHIKNNGKINNWAGILIPTKRYKPTTIVWIPFGFKTAKLKAARPETVKFNIKVPITKVSEFVNIWV